jgi:predicted methyltransferase
MRPVKTLPLAFAALLLSASALYADPDAIKAALADPARGKDADIDARRHPGELAAFAGIKTGDIVVDLIPGTGYFTKVFSPLVGHDGRVYAVWPDAYATVDGDDLAPMLTAMQDKHYDNVRVFFQPADKFTTPRPADVVFTSQNYHDYPDKFMGNIDPKVLNEAVFAALKPGGVYIVVDHVAEAGSGMRDTDTLHRIDPALVKAQVTAAGFIFDGESDVLRNPADDHKVRVFDKPIQGHTDQFIYRFKKPG